MKIKIPHRTIPKKNSQRIIINPRTQKPMIIQSKSYLEFEKLCGFYLKKYKGQVEGAVNICATFYVGDKRRRDLINLEEAIADILVKYAVLPDDNYEIIQSWDGSRIIYEKGREETIINIEEV